MVYGTYNERVTGAYKPTNITWGPRIVCFLFSLKHHFPMVFFSVSASTGSKGPGQTSLAEWHPRSPSSPAATWRKRKHVKTCGAVQNCGSHDRDMKQKTLLI